MSIICKICNQEFEKIIPWQHLKTHNISTADYKKEYGDVYSKETLDKFRQRVPHNKGQKVTDPEKIAIHRQKIAQRELKFQQGLFKRGTKKTEEQKKVLSQKSKEYAKNNKDEIKARAHKAIETKIKNNYDFGKNMRGRTHTEETKLLIGEKSKVSNRKKSQEANVKISQRIKELNLNLVNNIDENNLKLICNICNTEFSFTKQYFHLSKIKSTICPCCYPRQVTKSQGELELYQYVKEICPSAVSGFRQEYHSKEIDIFVPDLNIGIEFNGLYWHSESVLLSNNRSPKSDYEKQKEFNNNGIRLIQVFEDEWVNKKEIVKSRIRNILNQTDQKIYARKCTVMELSPNTASQFCNNNHIMGAGRSNIRFGLYFNNELVSVMTFSTSNISRKISAWELNRYSSKINTTVVGGASKLFRHFVKQVKPNSVVSYSDNRWSNGGLYQQLGFKKIHSGSPNYWYMLPNLVDRIHRFSLRKSIDNPNNLKESELREQQGYNRIWDSGSSRWEWQP